MKNRTILNYINSLKDKTIGRIIILTGPRQAGKTTLVRHFLPEYEYLPIEDPTRVNAFRALSIEQWHKDYPKAALDEIQKVPILFDSIKATYDSYPDVRYILLGSSQILLLQKVRESLAGRCVLLDIFPLTLPEMRSKDDVTAVPISFWQSFLQHHSTINDIISAFIFDNERPAKVEAWQHYCRYGGYPALLSEETEEEKFLWLHNYVRTYLERDVRDLAAMRDLEPFQKLQVALAGQTGNLINSSSLGRIIGVTSKTVDRYIEYLNISYQVIVLPAWSRNLNKRMVKSPKIHFMDNGVLQAVLQKRGGITGGEFESLVISEIYKQAKSIVADARFYHYRTADGAEVDLLVETPDGYYAFEIKQSEKVSRNEAKHLYNLAEILDKPYLHGFLLSNDMQTQHFADNVTAVNVNYFLG